MTDTEIKIAVAEQIINMLENDIINKNGGESFLGWLGDGEVFRINGMSEEDTLRAVNLAKSIDDEVTSIVFTLEKYDEDED